MSLNLPSKKSTLSRGKSRKFFGDFREFFTSPWKLLNFKTKTQKVELETIFSPVSWLSCFPYRRHSNLHWARHIENICKLARIFSSFFSRRTKTWARDNVQRKSREFMLLDVGVSRQPLTSLIFLNHGEREREQWDGGSVVGEKRAASAMLKRGGASFRNIWALSMIMIFYMMEKN